MSRPAATGSAAEPDALSVTGASVALGGRQVLDGVTFRIRPGEFTGLIGSNGAGKTTLLRVILGLQPGSGSVQIAGRPQRKARRLVGYVPQKITLDPDLPLRARDVVGLGLDGHRLGLAWPSRTRRDRIEQALAAVDATRFADARVGNLSGGEQQRVLIAHALISQPRLLLLDEPLANLDVRSEHAVVTLLSRIATERAIGVLLSAHDMNPLLGAMDRIVYVADGRVVSGSTEEVIQTDVLSRLYGHHVDVIRLHDRIVVSVSAAMAGQQPGEHDPIVVP